MIKVAVIGGAGLMGHGIVLACLQKNCEVWMVSRREESLEHGLFLVNEGPFGLKKALAKGKISAEEYDTFLHHNLHASSSYAEALPEADYVFESIPEIVEQKQQCLAEVEKYAPKTAIIASNTSAIMISELGGVLAAPGRFVGTHWFYPSNVMPLVEVGKSELTSPETLEATVKLLLQLGKKPVIVKDSPGFFMTRFINAYARDAMLLYEQGIASMADIDQMVKTGLGWPMGVFEMMDDTASFEAWYHAQEYLWATLGDDYKIPASARKVYKAGYLGSPLLKPGSKGGWYEFFGEQKPGKDEQHK